LSSEAYWVSANGLVAGASQNGQIIDLGTLPKGGNESGAQSVNSSGQVVGWALNTVADPTSMLLVNPFFNYYQPYQPGVPFQTRAFVWQRGVMQDLGTLGTGTDAWAWAINEQGQVIGISYTSATPNPANPCTNGPPVPSQDPFLWENGKMIDLGTLGGTCGYPTWINNQGQVVGESYLAGDTNYDAFLWTKEKGMQDLGTMDGRYVEPYLQMINDFGVAVGYAVLSSNNQITDAVMWNGTWHDLGNIDGCALAYWTSAQGQVVGSTGNECQGTVFLWENGGPMVDLSTLVVGHNGFTLIGQDAVYINDQGEIAARGIPAVCNYAAIGCTHDAVLIPCDENHPNIEGCDYSLVESLKAVEAHASQIAGLPEAAASQSKMSATKIINRFRSMMSSLNRNFGPAQQAIAWGPY